MTLYPIQWKYSIPIVRSGIEYPIFVGWSRIGCHILVVWSSMGWPLLAVWGIEGCVGQYKICDRMLLRWDHSASRQPNKRVWWTLEVGEKWSTKR